MLHAKLEEEYQGGFKKHKNAEQFIEMKTMRLTFLNIGPKIQNLEFFENLDSLYLQHNCLQEIGRYSLQFNLKLQILNLSHNKIKIVEGLDQLKELVFLDLSFNQISKINPKRELPKALTYLRMHDNPVASSDPEYRQKCVVALDMLLEMDRIKCVMEERMIYRGLLPGKGMARVEQLLTKYRKERQEQEARERMEFDLYVEMMEDQGVSQRERIEKRLEQFGDISLENGLFSNFEHILNRMKGMQQAQIVAHKDRFKMIEEQFQNVLKKYPGAKNRKRKKKEEIGNQIIEEAENEEDDEEEQEEGDDEFEEYSRQLDLKIEEEALKRMEKRAAGGEVTNEALMMARGEATVM